jgi:hypothetical protein
MAQASKQQSNPFSTGGGGPNFETRVQAAFVILMLSGRHAYHLFLSKRLSFKHATQATAQMILLYSLNSKEQVKRQSFLFKLSTVLLLRQEIVLSLKSLKAPGMILTITLLILALMLSH